MNSLNNKIENLCATRGDSDGSVDLQWDPRDNAHSYIIQRKSERGLWRYVDIINESRYTVTRLKPKQKYFFRVAAVSHTGQGEWSDPAWKKSK